MNASLFVHSYSKGDFQGGPDGIHWVVSVRRTPSLFNGIIRDIDTAPHIGVHRSMVEWIHFYSGIAIMRKIGA